MSTTETSACPEIPDYVVLEFAGSAGGAAVYLARQVSRDRLVALKVPAPESDPAAWRARFRTEAETLARLDHPGIVRLCGSGEHQGVPFLATEWLAEGSLRRLFAVPLSSGMAARLVAFLAGAIQHAHQRGVVHGDLSPDVVLFTPEPGPVRLPGPDGQLVAPRIAGFGAVGRQDPSPYRAPELLRGERPGPAADIYSLGALLFHLLAGRPPGEGGAPGLSPGLEAVCRRCLADNPAQRYPTATALATALGAAVGSLAAPPDTLSPDVTVKPGPVLAAPPEPSAFPTVPGFTVLAKLGGGGMGVVYRARQEGLNRVVALKMIKGDLLAEPRLRKRFYREAEAMARLDHPFVVKVFAVGEANGQPYLALEYVEGGTLRDRLAGRPQPVRAACELVVMLARGVQVAHEAGVVHRDLKPENVLLAAGDLLAGSGGQFPEATQEYGRPRVADFGLAKRQDHQGTTRRGEVIGTPQYMAPEQAWGPPEEVGPAADVYGLGAILYEMLTGRPPLVADTLMDMIRQLQAEEPLAPRLLRPGLPEDLEAVCLKCLAKSPRARYPNAGELADDLERFLDGQPTRARPVGTVRRLWRWARRAPLVATLLVALTAALGYGLVDLWFLPERLVRKSAEESCAQQAQMLEDIRQLYTQVRAEATKSDCQALPLPFQFQILLERRPSPEETKRSVLPGAETHNATRVLIYSDYPFRERAISPPTNHPFGREALDYFSANGLDASPPSRLETDSEGRRFLRYAVPIRMQRICADCHNEEEKKLEEKGELFGREGRKRWKKDDFRGVMEIVRPVEKDFQEARRTLGGIYLRVGLVAGGLLAIGALLFGIGRRRGRALRD